MSMDSSKSSKFTFQSSVHSSHVLQCLNEQRKRDVLCDVTVVAENQSFRAHRAVLVSCSEYLSSPVPGHTAQGVVINLPDEVTADGFDALLEFAYTSKLIFTKENVLEIRNCASVLGFKNLDTACFDFLLPKFFNSSRSASKVQRKQCCKTKCCKSRGAELSLINKEDVIDDDKLLLQPSQFQFKEKEPSCPPSALTEDATGSCQNAKGEKQTDYSSLCPKYRKFQIACGKERPCLDACSSEATPMSPEKIDDGCPLNYLPCSSNTEMVSACRTPPIIGEEHTFLSQCCPLMNSPSFHTPCGPCMDQLSLPSCSESTESICASTEKEMPPCSGVNGNERAFKCDGNRELRDGNEIFSPDQNNMSKSEQRSREEIEVARQLTFWPDTCPSWASSSNQGLVDTLSNLKCRQSSTLDPRAVECPFLKELDAMGAQMHDGEGSTSQGSPYVPSNQSGEDSDSFDTEGDSESYSSERMCAMALPFSVEQIVSLSRNDFQQMLKQQCLTREQLDVVHDIRRRSKNRIAARRCRKRKLDCIHNLECEIEKLRSEREKLTAERIQLNQMKLKAWQSYSGLYEKVCAEAALRPEQLQVLAKYSSPDCPISAFLCPSPDLSQSPDTQPQSSGLPLGFSPCVSTHTCCSEARPSAGSLLDNTVGLAKSSSQNPLPAGNVEARSYTSPNDTTPSEKSGC